MNPWRCTKNVLNALRNSPTNYGVTWWKDAEKLKENFQLLLMNFVQQRGFKMLKKLNQNKWVHGGLNLWPHHVKNHENKEVKEMEIRTTVLAGKCNLKEKNKKWEEWDSNPPPLNQI